MAVCASPPLPATNDLIHCQCKLEMQKVLMENQEDAVLVLVNNVGKRGQQNMFYHLVVKHFSSVLFGHVCPHESMPDRGVCGCRVLPDAS